MRFFEGYASSLESYTVASKIRHRHVNHCDEQGLGALAWESLKKCALLE